ncbi:MAG TPA: hypothetical protein DDZ89_08470, partial [Clostridiales bacterium]|nr:hypothetical protein [Clostridiales bacterium]
MYIGSLAKQDSTLSGVYSYHKRGTQIPAEPDLLPDINTGEIGIQSGNLFNNQKVGWKWTTLLDVGVDIVIELNKACFIDRIIINQEPSSGIGAVEVLTSTGEKTLSFTGRMDAATGQALEQSRLAIPVGETADKIVIRLTSCFKNII